MSFAHDDHDNRDDYDDDYHGGHEQPHRGVLILVFGIIGIMNPSCFLLGILSIVAWILGKRDLESIKRGLMDKEGESFTRVGYILGIVGTILFLLQVLFIVAYVGLIMILLANN